MIDLDVKPETCSMTMQSPPPSPILDIRDLRVVYDTPFGPIEAVRGVNLTVHQGELYGIAGESGCGKTTLANAILRLLPKSGRIASGQILFNGVDLATLSDEDMRIHRWKKIALIPQGSMSSLNPVMRVWNQIADVIYTHEGRQPRRSLSERIAHLLTNVGLDERVADMYPHELSGGMKQRVCVAMAIALNPLLIIADEPTSALDVVVQYVVAQTLLEIQQRLGVTILLIGHDMGLMAQTMHRLAIMHEGTVVEQGSVAQIFKAPRHVYTQTLIDSLPSFDKKKTTATAPADEVNADQLAVPLLEVRSLTKVFGRAGFLSKSPHTIALKDFSLTLPTHKASIVTIAGESGSGKTTFGNLVLRFLTPTSGQVLYKGEDVHAMTRRQLTQYRREVQAIFQDPYEVYNPIYKVEQALCLVIRKFHLARTREEGQSMIHAALDAVGLKPSTVLGKFPHELSGGQRQRLMVARAFLLKPRLILADEPVSMVDASLRSMILDYMLELKQTLGTSFLYISHDLSTAYQISDEIVILYRGSVVERGEIETVIKSPQHAYTQLLLNSIPLPDPDRKWRAGIIAGEAVQWVHT